MKYKKVLSFDKALTLNPSNLYFWDDKVHLLKELGRCEKALDW